MGATPLPADEHNALVFDGRWSASRRITQVRPHLWRELEPRLRDGALLEIGPGLRPTIRVQGSHFADISAAAVAALRARGGIAHRYAGGPLPLPDESADLVCAFEVLEHVQDDEALLREVARVLRPGGLFVFSVPLHMALWTSLDRIAAHVRRYEPGDLRALLGRARLDVERYEVFT
ncbi:MAG: class I SAM-dependent methyltransferase, partial [Actinomycetota bacterium]|nr:class I SAM-dependent methyltransferase [Actinomycetota bacterium]